MTVEATLNEEVGTQSATSLAPGELLASLRAEHGLSIDQVADSLRYSPRQLAALESDDYAALPGATVVRGMVRGYAKHLGIDPEPLIANLRTRLGGPPPSLVVREMSVPFPGRPSRGHRFYVIGSIVLALIAVALLMNWNFGVQAFLRGMQDSATAVQEPRDVSASAAADKVVTPLARAEVPLARAEVAPEPSLEAGGAVVSSSANAMNVPSPTTAVASESAEAAPGDMNVRDAVSTNSTPTASPVQTPVAPPPADQKRIELNFDGESWVHIRSGAGDVLLNDLNPSGTQRVVTGPPPFQIVIGAARGVRMRYEDAPFDLVPHIREDVARIVLN